MKIKQDAYSNKQFNLTVEDTEKLIERYFVKAYPDAKFSVHKSNYSNSVYVEIDYLGSRVTIRLSDHKYSKYNHSYVVNECTPIYHVAKYIDKGLADLMKYRLFKFLNINKNNLL